MAYRIDFLERVDGLRRPARQRFEDERHRIVMIGHLGIDDSSFLSRPCLWNASAEPTRSQMPFASSSCCSTLTSWYFKEDDPALMTSTFNDLPPSVFLKHIF